MKTALILALVALQGLDVATTNAFLASGHGVEGNPIMALAMEYLGAHWWLIKLAVLAVAVPVLASHRTRLRYVVGMVALYSFIIVNNLMVI
jgi:hypothetical protein